MLDRKTKPLYLVALRPIKSMYRTSLEHAPLAGEEAAPAVSGETDTWRTLAGWAWATYLLVITAVVAWALLS